MTEGTARRAVVASMVTLALGSAAPARAQSEEPGLEATIVRIDEDDVFIDLGGEEARRDLELDAYRTVEVRHPVTRSVLRDRFVIGRVRVVNPGETLSIARVVGTPHRPLQVGDAVEGTGAAASGAGPSRVRAAEPTGACPEAACAPCPACAAGSTDPEAREVVAAWQATLGKPPEERRRIYGIFLQRNPESRFALAVQEEIRALHRIEERERQLEAGVEEALRAREQAAVVGAVEVDPLELAQAGERTEVAAAVDPTADVEALLLYVRPLGARGTAYRVLRMDRDGRGHARATVPAALVTEPGFEYFVEAVAVDGRAAAVLGSSSEPTPVAVVPPPEQARLAAAGRSRIHLSSELVSFNRFEGNDWYLITEADFLYRVLFHALYGVRVGYGHFTGEGGTVDALEMGADPQPAGFTYGYLELETRLSDLFALMGRVTVGLGSFDEDRVHNDSGVRGGFQLRLRIGPERGTNLVLAGETIPEIGQRAFIGLTWEVIEDVPMTAEVHVTDQPINSDELAVRGIFQVGYRVTEQLALAARLSYQGRTIDHAGLGAGLAATFDW